MGWFSNWVYMGMKLCHWQKFRSCTYTQFLSPGGRNWAYFHSTDSGFQDGAIFKISILGMKLAKWPKCQKLHIPVYPLSTPGSWYWAYFCYTGSGFRDIGPFSKLPYLGMKHGKWLKFQKLHICYLSTPRGQNWAYFCSTGSGSEIRANFQNCHIWTWNLASGQSSRSCTCTCTLCHGKWLKFQKLHICSLSTPGGRNWLEKKTEPGMLTYGSRTGKPECLATASGTVQLMHENGILLSGFRIHCADKCCIFFSQKNDTSCPSYNLLSRLLADWEN